MREKKKGRVTAEKRRAEFEMGMKFSTSKETLMSLVMPAVSAVTTKNTLAALEGVLFTLSGSTLKVCGYDLEKGVQTEGMVNAESDGEIILNAQKISSIIRSLPDCEVTFETNERYIVNISGGNSEFSISGLDGEAFPNLPVLSGEKAFIISKSKFKNIIRKTSFSVSNNETKPVLTGEYFVIDGNTISAVAVDYSRLAIREESEAVSSFGEKISFIVPGKSISDFAKLVPDEDGEVHIEITKKHIIMAYDNVVFFSRLLEGEYMDYEKVVPAECKIYVKIKRNDFINGVERVALFVDEKLNTPIKCAFTGNNLNISCFTALGEGNDNIEIEKEGIDIEIGFNHRLILDALRACDDEIILLGLNSPKMSMLMSSCDPNEKSKYRYLVLPCHLKESAT